MAPNPEAATIARQVDQMQRKCETEFLTRMQCSHLRVQSPSVQQHKMTISPRRGLPQMSFISYCSLLSNKDAPILAIAGIMLAMPNAAGVKPLGDLFRMRARRHQRVSLSAMWITAAHSVAACRKTAATAASGERQ